jgi:predicted O-methyltransferase YrrM
MGGRSSLSSPNTSLRKYIAYAVGDPVAALYFVRGGREAVRALSLRRAASLIGADASVISRHFATIREEVDFQKEMARRLSEGGAANYGQVQSQFEIYAILRCVQPDIVVETGVASGVSSAYILKAMHDSGKGTLYSIDLPNYELEYFPDLGLTPVSLLPKGTPPGFAVPDFLKHRWNLTLGRSQDLLPKLLEELGSIDIFFHDSEHTLENMFFEYNQAWPHIMKGGILLSDDVDFNTAFMSFCKSVGSRPVLFPFAGLGCVAK